MLDDSRQGRAGVIRQFWTVACLDWVCVNCGCGRSIELEEEADDPDDSSTLTQRRSPLEEVTFRPQNRPRQEVQ